MKTTAPAVVVSPQGADDRLLPMPSSARRVVNMRWSEGGFFHNDRGWEPLQPREAGHLHSEDELAPVRSLWCYTRHSGAEIYYLYERAGELAYDYGNDASGTADGHVSLATGRSIPGVSDPGSQLVTCGRFAAIFNGYDLPVKFYGGRLLTRFGFDAPPPPPIVMDTDPGLRVSVLASDGFTFAGDDACALGRLGLVPAFLGTPFAGTTSYSYRVTWISDSGSESPMSPEVTIGWSLTAGAPDEWATFAVYLSYLPTGPDNVVARRIYRTKNMGTGADVDVLQGEGRIFYFVAQIDDNCTDAYVDTTVDSRLTIRAPDPQESEALPQGLRFGAMWDGRMWLGGGTNCATRIVYSKQSAPEQFGAFDFYDLGGLGGEITQVVAHQGRLVVFRRRGIDVIEFTQDLGYRLSTLSSLIGTTASNTVADVPGFGLVFLAADGVYSLTGSGPPVRISDSINGEMSRIGAGPLARATATYSAKEGEYWVQYPADGAAENVRGAVLHVHASTERPVWSLRHITPTDPASQYRMVLTALATDPNGWIVFGTAPIDTGTGGAYPGSATLPSVIPGHVIENLGLQVWSAKPAAGSLSTIATLSLGGEEIGFTITTADASRLEAIWQSEWSQFGTRTSIFHVEMWMLNTGKPALTMEYAVDGREQWTAGPVVNLEPYETSGTSSVDHVYGLDTEAARRSYQAKWGTSVWREDRLVRVLWHVALPKGAAGSFAFRLRSTDPIGVVAYTVGQTPTNIGTASQVTTRGGA